MNESSKSAPEQAKSSLLVRNPGEPIKLSNVQLAGISVEAARGGQIVKICTRMRMTSDELLFHRIVEGFTGHIVHRAAQAAQNVHFTNASTVLLVIHPDDSADLWIDAAVVSLKIMTKRSLEPGSMVFENDIADVSAMSFPFVDIRADDRVVCIFREGWRFGLFFDLVRGEDLSLANMEEDLGLLYRRMRYRDLYDAIAAGTVFSRLVDAGWFPFVEILGREFRGLADHCNAGFGLDNIETSLVGAFDAERLERMFTRWMLKPHFAGKERLLRSALNNFESGDSVSVLKIVLTEIEGILMEAYQRESGKGAKLKKLLEFAIKSAQQKAGQPDTLLFPEEFAQYLATHTFAKFDPVTKTGKASSRHAVGHGAADTNSYTQVRALQALLTLDQLAFYT